MDLASLVHRALGSPETVRVTAYDGSHAGPEGAPATLDVTSADALTRIVTRPGELGFARAYVAGDIDLHGDLFAALESVRSIQLSNVPRTVWVDLAKIAKANGLRRLPPPPEEASLHGRRHSIARDAASIKHHYDVSNDFYRLVLGPSMTYSCAVFETDATTLEDAQAAKHELISRKLALEPGMRMLDVGCGWGSLLLHAAEHHGTEGVGVTISQAQVELASKRVAESGYPGLVEIRLQDYREVADGPFDAISSVGMFEHVGRAHFATYARTLYDQLRPGGRLLNHAISRPGVVTEPTALGQVKATARRIGYAAGSSRSTRTRSPFIQHYVFPDGELQEVGSVVSILQEQGFEVRHVESLREHYVRTLRHWVDNLESRWDDAVAFAGEGRARVWRLYMAASALGFEHGGISVHQVLAARPDGGRSGFSLRPEY
jgi:cyclopropane-fatty-acyl-phospholipid synthase